MNEQMEPAQNEEIQPQSKEANDKKLKWYFHGGTLVLAFVIVGPFMLPLVWLHPRYSSSRKVFLTVLILIISAVLLKATMHSWENISDYYGVLEGTY